MMLPHVGLMGFYCTGTHHSHIVDLSLIFFKNLKDVLLWTGLRLWGVVFIVLQFAVMENITHSLGNISCRIYTVQQGDILPVDKFLNIAVSP